MYFPALSGVKSFLFRTRFPPPLGSIYRIRCNFVVKRMNMKKSIVFLMGALLMLAVGMSSCSSDEDSGIDVLQTDKCRYEPQNIRPIDALETVTTQEGWEITTYGGVVTKAVFNSQPPSSPEQFFSKNLKTTESIILKFSSSLKNSQVNYADYCQLYQGTYIPGTGYTCYFDDDDKLMMIEGIFVPIEDLNTTPSICGDEADTIFSRFLNKEVKGSMLQITPFYQNGKIDVRLTYYIDDYMGGCFAHYRCLVDAHSGEVLLSEFPHD